jgi:glycerophosphoryl diester phosphodiesterase
MLAIAHRAGNSLADLRGALDAGVDLVEADVHLIREALQVRHRRRIGRRPVSGLPVLDQVLAAAAGDPRLMLDLKGPMLGVAPRVAALLRRDAPGVPVTICTKQWRMLDAFEADPHVRRVFSASTPLQLARLRLRLRRTPAFGVSIRRTLLTPAIVAELRRRGTIVMAWPVDTELAFEHAARLGVSAVISKNLALLRRIVAAR